MDFEINTAEFLKIDDIELSDLLTQVYVTAGFMEPAEAITLLAPSAVRGRGVLLGAREKKHQKLAGVVIVVPPDSPARRMAKNGEAEMHLLGVRPEYRGQGLGRMLVEAAIDRAKQNGYSKIILWTQLSMRSAQKLYEATGFIYIDEMQRNSRSFKVYELALAG